MKTIEMTDKKPLSERVPTMDELKEKVALLECKIKYNCPYPDRVESLEDKLEQLGTMATNIGARHYENDILYTAWLVKKNTDDIAKGIKAILND